MSERPTTRRAVLKATGALGTIAALAVPVAVLPKAEASEMADVELLRLGAELEALWAQEQAAIEEADRLANLAERLRPAPSDVLLAYRHEGLPLFNFEAGMYRLNPPVFAYVKDCERAWRVCGFREGPCPEAELLPDLASWKAGREKAWDANGTTATDEEFERISEIRSAVGNRIITMPARTSAGLAVKLRALTICRADGPEDDYIGEVITSPKDYTTDQRMAFSVLRDALAILGVGAAHV